MKHEGWTPARAPPSPTREPCLYEELLLSQAVPRGIVAASDSGPLRAPGTSWIASGRSRTCQTPQNRRRPWVRRGLPGLPIAVVRPDLEVTLAESRQTRAAFLELAVERLRYRNVSVFPAARGGARARLRCVLGDGDSGMSHAPGRSPGPCSLPEGALLYWAGRTFAFDDAPPGASSRALAKRLLKAAGPSLS